MIMKLALQNSFQQMWFARNILGTTRRVYEEVKPATRKVTFKYITRADCLVKLLEAMSFFSALLNENHFCSIFHFFLN